MITPEQAAQRAEADMKHALAALETKMDREIDWARTSGKGYAFVIVEDWPEAVKIAIREKLCPKYVAAGWAGATCWPHQHFMVHFTEASCQTYTGYWQERKRKGRL